MKLPLKLAALVAALLAILAAGGPLVTAGQVVPPADLAQGAPLSSVPLLTPPPVDTSAELASISADTALDTPPRFGVSLAVDAAPAVSGAWETLADGTQLWRLRVRSAEAQALSLGFTRYTMPAGGRLWVYDPAYELVHGPYTAADNEAHGQLWTPIVHGDTIVIEAQLPAGAARESLALRLGSVVHGVLDPFSPAVEKSGSCNVDVVCPQADLWRSQIRSVARITVGPFVCTGALINNTTNDRRPLFLTAEHCDIDAGNAPSVVTYWNYVSPVCRTPGSVESGGDGGGSLSQTLSGAIWRAEHIPADMTLLELDDAVPDTYNAFWAGWDRQAAAPTSAVAIHHPSGDEKRISFENQAATITSYGGSAVPGNSTHIRITDWDLGTTEGGSSGSPLFNQSGLVVGQLHGGAAACGNDASDWYGRLYTSWTGGGTLGTRLSDYLDPVGTGATQLSGVDALPPVNYTESVGLPIVGR